MTKPPGFSNKELIFTIGLDTFHYESRVMYQKYLFWYKVMPYNDQVIELELMDDHISRNPLLNGTYHCQSTYRVSLCLRT
jgi:hypothetical protein